MEEKIRFDCTTLTAAPKWVLSRKDQRIEDCVDVQVREYDVTWTENSKPIRMVTYSDGVMLVAEGLFHRLDVFWAFIHFDHQFSYETSTANSINLCHFVDIVVVPDGNVVKNVVLLRTTKKTFILEFNGSLERGERIDIIKGFYNNCVMLNQLRNPLFAPPPIETIRITNTENVIGGNIPYTIYKIQYNSKDGVFYSKHRYSDFVSFLNRVASSYPHSSGLPKKHRFTSLKSDVIECRRIMLERFLIEMVQQPQVRELACLKEFLMMHPSGQRAEASIAAGN